MADLDRIYRSLFRIRRVEEEIARVYPTDVIKSPVHLSIGQESVSVGLCEALRPDDAAFGTYRSHALYLAKGGDLRAMIAELYGKATGCAGGKGGSMHMIDVAAGVFGSSAVVGTTIPHAVGYAYAVKLRRESRVVACVFGDGAVDEGVFYESLNFAALKRLPVIFVCENNSYAIHTHQRLRQRVADVCARVTALGIPAERIDDGDVLRIATRARAASDALRGGDAGPVFIECMTYRWKEHVGPGEDWNLGYRERVEAEPWIRGDQVARLATAIDQVARKRIESEVEAEIADAFAFAEGSPFPDPAALHTQVFRESS
ncbi:MAG: thiamine pyrophosphate-dependent dehydrogenase E1 component subunit alpha [Proteobacteria bacterium]|nr:thiamine pyrophosphate-dependent dehydrogenase E1 component subunit alpha [Pseudomonadota bacterium]